jgi:serine O-acetyltransferase
MNTTVQNPSQSDVPSDATPADSIWPLDEVVAELQAARAQWREARHRLNDPGDREFPSREAVAEIIKLLRAALFPLRLGPTELRRDNENAFIRRALGTALDGLLRQVRLELEAHRRAESTKALPLSAEAVVTAFAAELPKLRKLLDADVEAAYRGDPAASSVDEVLLCYPGVLAMLHHRLAHALYGLGAGLIARMIAEQAHSETGIDIHPGATIGPQFFIDHGTGVVIGETAIIGTNVRLYQQVTLGAKRFETAADGSLVKGVARHPIVEDDVVIYAGATVLGRVTIGAGSTIGGNVWLTHSVPPGSNITQAQSEQRPS